MNYFIVGGRRYQYLPDNRVFWSSPHSQCIGTAKTTAQALSLAARHAQRQNAQEAYEARATAYRQSPYAGRQIAEA